MNFSNKTTWLIHIVAWILYMLSPILFLPNIFLETALRNGFLIPKLIEDILIIIFFYANFLYYTPKLLRNGSQLRFWIYIILWFIGICVIYSSISFFFMKPDLKMMMPNLPNPKNALPFPQRLPLPFFPLFFRVIPVFVFATLISSLIVIIQDRLSIREQKQSILLEKIASELEVLKLQISPHFLFNTLNNIRWLARQKSENTEEAIVKLSTLLRYILYETKSEKVPLLKEIRNLEDFISLQKMRLAERTTVDFKYSGDIKNHQIEPLLFIPFVENAFKYGVHNEQQSKIEISIEVLDNKLIFKIKNNVFADNQNSNEEGSGIGIKNVEQRLKLIYPETHQLKITENAGIYEVNLVIILENKTPQSGVGGL